MERCLYYNFDEQNNSWETIPDWLWGKLLENYLCLGDQLGFKGLHQESQMSAFGFFDTIEVGTIWSGEYHPYCVPPAVPDPANYLERLLFFEITSELLKQLRLISLDELFLDNDYIPTEEIVFRRNERILMTISNVDNHVYFYDLSAKELQLLESYGEGVQRGLLNPNQ